MIQVWGFGKEELDSVEQFRHRLPEIGRKHIKVNASISSVPVATGEIRRMFCRPFEDSDECERYYEYSVSLGERRIVVETEDILTLNGAGTLPSFTKRCMDAVDGLAMLASGGDEEKAFILLEADREATRSYIRKAVASTVGHATGDKT